MDRRNTLRSAVTIALVLAVGFSAGFSARPPIQSLTSKLKATMMQRSRRRALAEQYLGKPAPPIATTDLAGNPIRIDKQTGKVVLVFFWASWCPYSRAAVPAIKSIAQHYAGRTDFSIIGVSLDRQRSALASYASTHSIDWTNLYEDGKVWGSSLARAYQIRSVPSRWIIDASGKIRGIDLDQYQTEDMLALLLDGKHLDSSVRSARAAPEAGDSCSGT